MSYLLRQKLYYKACIPYVVQSLRLSPKWNSCCIHNTQLVFSKKSDISSLFIPVAVKPSPDDINVGLELTGQLDKGELLKILNKFYQKREVKVLASENGLDNYLLHQAYIAFRRYCTEVPNLPVDLHIVISDILQGAGHIDDIFPYFLRFAKQMFPHLECMDDLKNISDLRSPANWYPTARAINRKIIFHAGPTNSGKTYQAMERFINAKSGLYCGPLKLLATEVCKKTNERGTPCDLVTGEERKFAINEDNPANHVSCTVEMTSFTRTYEVAIVDEIQMVRDMQRGWAWTRALLGLCAEEVHLCGEEGAVDLVKEIMSTTNEDVQVYRYKRLTKLEVEDKAVQSLNNVVDGDCIVCFNKNDVYTVSRGIEARGKEVAVIYGSLPPNTKLAQAQKFNDPNNTCNVLVATDAIGMGLNLSIRRVIFYSLIKPMMNEKGEKEMDTISVSQALQIAGRAGRYGTQYSKGYVTAYKNEDLSKLKEILSKSPEPITKAGLHPTADQIELYAYHLPNSTLSNLLDIFITLSTVDDSLYFMCAVDDFKFLADMLQHIPLSLRARYVFCCAPINRKMPFVCATFLKYARQYSKNQAITFDWLCRQIGWPLTIPRTILDLVHLEAIFDVLDLYLWFSYRFPDIFADQAAVRDMQAEIDSIIQQAVLQITRLLRNSEASTTTFEEDFNALNKKQSYLRSSNTSDKKEIGKGRLTERLIAQGLLTPSMIQELKREWVKTSDEDADEDRQDEERNNNDHNNNTTQSRKNKRKRKPKF